MKPAKTKLNKSSTPPKRTIQPATKTGKLSPRTVARIVKTVVRPKKGK